MRKPIAQRIKELEHRKRSLQSRLDRQERARETRRKILLGSFLLQWLDRPDETSDQCDLKQRLKRELPAFLSRDADRALFADLLGPMQVPSEESRIGQILETINLNKAAPIIDGKADTSRPWPANGSDHRTGAEIGF